ncbi:MAG: FtsX-like permease family protein, partial [Clostridiales bacterium]|nr:FtsX-like permease family protein [Clostridiales bacterium]
LMGAQDRYDSCYIMTYEDSQLDAAGQEAVNILKARHNNFDRQVYVATNMASLVELLDAVISIFTLFIAAVSGISLVVGGIGVMNIMFVSVTERTREIGIRKALGARTSTILFQFLTESVILCMVGGVIGLILGVAGALAVSSLMNVPITIKISTILIAVGFSSAIGIFFGIYPAKRAAQMPPIEALRRM